MSKRSGRWREPPAGTRRIDWEMIAGLLRVIIQVGGKVLGDWIERGGRI